MCIIDGKYRSRSIVLSPPGLFYIILKLFYKLIANDFDHLNKMFNKATFRTKEFKTKENFLHDMNQEVNINFSFAISYKNVFYPKASLSNSLKYTIPIYRIFLFFFFFLLIKFPVFDQCLFRKMN